MPTIKIAHIREQSQDMIIVPFDESFERQTDLQKNEAIAEIQLASRSAGLAGEVVAIWPYGTGTKFIAPKPWHPFFQSLGYHQAVSLLNRDLSW